VASTTIDKMVDYVTNTPEDGLRSRASVETRSALISKNLELMNRPEYAFLKRQG
jgi:hypothetical protein